MKHFRNWRHDARGTVAMVFGLAAVAVTGLIGAALDFSRAASTQTSLQRALDGVALLAAKSRDKLGGTPMTDEQATDYVRQTFPTARINGLNIKITFQGDRVLVTGSAIVPTTIANVIGVKEVPVSGVAEAMFDTRVEIVLVLDTTGSMRTGEKLPTLKAAAKSFIDKMERSPTAPSNVKIGLVPFEENVNLGGMKYASWVDSAQTQSWITSPGTLGCIWDRAKDYDVSDANPISSDTKFGADPNRTRDCAVAPMVQLTNNFDLLRTTIDGMKADGATNLTIGLAWGLHLLTPSSPVTNAAPLRSPDVSKYIIFMTDGLNNKSRHFKAKDDTDTATIAQLNDRTKLVCRAIKDSDIKVYTAKIIEGDSNVLSQCATSTSMHYDVTEIGQLSPVFDKIYNSMVGTRLSR